LVSGVALHGLALEGLAHHDGVTLVRRWEHREDVARAQLALVALRLLWESQVIIGIWLSRTS
jgi:hypothetical protein